MEDAARFSAGPRLQLLECRLALLGALIERITGRSYARFIEERILHPAGMRETGYHLVLDDSSRVARTYTPPVDHGTPAQRLAESKGPWWNLMANGGMLTTVSDLYKYELALRRGAPVSHAIQRKQFAPQFRRSTVLANGYDWWIEPAEDGGVQYNRGGDANAEGLNAEYRRYSSDSAVFILLANNRHHGYSSRRYVMPNMRKLLVGSATIDPPAVKPASSDHIAPLAGFYQVDSASYFRVDTSRGRLTLSALGQAAVDVMVFNRDTTSIRNRVRNNERALAVIKAFATRDTAALAQSLGSAARGRRLMGAWLDAEKLYGAFRCVEALGTDRLDRGAFLTTLRLRFTDSTKTVRFTWNGTVPVVNSDDGRLVNNFGFAIDSPVDAGAWSPYWYASGADSLVTYDMITNQTLVARVDRAAEGAVRQLVFDLPRGPVAARRLLSSPGARVLPTWCAPGASQVGERAELAMTRYAMHGMSGSILLSDSGVRVLERGFAMADRERAVAASASTAYDVGSITKTFTAAAILRLVADGKIDLRALISKYFTDVPADKAAINVHDILTHTAGFALDPSQAGVAASDSRDVYVTKVLAAPLLQPPGKAYAYSNTGYGLLAILVEQVSGQDFRSFVNRTLVSPAGMTQTGWWGDVVAITGGHIARGYQFSDREYALSAEPPFSRGGSDSPMWSKWPLGAGGVITTVGDLDRWRAVLAEGRLLPDSLTRKLFESQTGAIGSQGYGWNIGSHIALGKRVSRGGGRTGFTSMLAYYPQRNASIAFALNQQADANWQSVVWRSLERALSGISDTLPPATVTLPTAALDSLAGRYAVAPGSWVTVAVENETLIVGAEGQGAAEVLVEQRPADSALVTLAHRTSARIIREAYLDDPGDATRAHVTDFPGLTQWLRARSYAALPAVVTVLGTVPHSAASVVQTFVRVGDVDRAHVVRLLWERNKVVAWGDGIRMPGFARFRMTSRNSAVAYHPRDVSSRTIEFVRGADGVPIGLVVMRPGATRSSVLQRITTR